MTESIAIDGVDVTFEPLGDGRVRVVADGREVGTLELVRDSTEFVARHPNGEPLRRWSSFGGEVTARFGSREVAARALLKS